MGVNARYRAIPHDCELLRRARQDREIAVLMQHFESNAEGWLQPKTPAETFFVAFVKELLQADPTLAQRYLYNPTRRWDQIIYLLSPAHRAGEIQNDQSLIHKAVWGSERLHPEARATQANPIGFVPAHEVRVIVDFLTSVTYEQLHEHYNPAHMEEMGVYKIWAETSEAEFQSSWEEFYATRNLYQEAAVHNEAVITVID